MIAAVLLRFPQDEGVVLQQLRGTGAGIYRVILSKPVTDLTGLSVTLQKGEGTVELLLKEPDKTSGGDFVRREGTLITFLNAAVGPLNAIPQENFDRAISKFGVVVKNTTLQKYKGTPMLNGNRYCVLDTTGKGAVPGTIVVRNPATNKDESFNIRYKGQTWFCRRCSEDHVGPCPALQAFFAAKDERKTTQIHTMIFSDSTLRRAEHVGLAAEVSCMPGGGIGEVANALLNDPKAAEMQHFALVAGTNDVHNKHFATEHEFAFSVGQGINKLATHMTKTPEKHLFVLNQTNYYEDSWEQESVEGRRQRLIDFQWASVAQSVRNISVVSVPRETVEHDDTDHPTDAGTRVLLKIIDQFYDKKLIINEKYITAQRLYQGLDAVFRFGCRCCSTDGHFTPSGFCGECVTGAGAYVSDKVWQAVSAALLPAGNKRPNDGKVDDGPGNKTAPPGGGPPTNLNDGGT